MRARPSTSQPEHLPSLRSLLTWSAWCIKAWPAARTLRPCRSLRAVSPTSHILLPAPSRSSLPTQPRPASPRFPPAEARAQQRPFRGRRRQLRRLDWRLPTEFLTRGHPGVFRANRPGRRRHRRHHRGLSCHHHPARHRRLARQRIILRPRQRTECSLPDRKSGAQSQTAVLTAELRRHIGRSDRAKQGLDVRLIRICSRERQYRLQPKQHHPIRCPVTDRRRWPDPRRHFHCHTGECTHSVPRLHRLAAFRLGGIQQVAMVPANFLRQLPHPQRAGRPSHAALNRTDHAQQLLEYGRQQHLRPSAPLGWERLCSTPAYCT